MTVMSLVLLVNSVLEIVGLGMLIPLITVLIRPESDYPEVLKQLQLALNIDGSQLVLVICASIAVFFSLKSLFHIFSSYRTAKFSYSLQRVFAERQMKTVLFTPFSEFSLVNSNKILRDISKVPNLFSTNVAISVLNLWNEVTVILFILVALIASNPSIILLLFVIVTPPLFIFYSYSRRRLSKITMELHEVAPNLTRTIFDAVHGYIDIKLSNSEGLFLNRLEKNERQLADLNISNYAIKQVPTRLLELVMVLALLAIIVYGRLSTSTPEVLSIITMLVLASYRLLPSVNRIVLANLTMTSNEYTIDILSKYTEPRMNFARKKISSFQAIKFNDVTFFYDPSRSRPAVSKVSFEVKAGESVGFIGKSGSGKTTLIKLMSMFLTPHQGQISINGMAQEELAPSDWWSILGYVQQETHISESSLAENIAFGSSLDEIDWDKLEECVRVSQLQDYVNAQPMGLRTVITEKGKNVSGGQRQRIGIARALYSGAKIFLFDEATSALDNETEQQVTESIRSLNHSGHTSIIVAHRLSTLKYCNRIIELEDGRITREMTYQDLKQD